MRGIKEMDDDELREVWNQMNIEICLRGLKVFPPKQRKMSKRQKLKESQRQWARERLEAMDRALEHDKS